MRRGSQCQEWSRAQSFETDWRCNGLNGWNSVVAMGGACWNGLSKLKQQSTTGISVQGLSDETQNPEDDPTRDLWQRVEEYKQKGNMEFGRGRYREATEAYTKGVDLVGEEMITAEAASGSGPLAVLLANRAACWLKRKQWQKALEDCNKVLRSGRIDDVAVKALFRRAKANEGLGDADSAMRDLNRVADIQPHNRDALYELDKYRSIMHRICVISNGTPEMRKKQRGET
ncbi:hypothetical protein CYMTET_35290 [Cymbomonas tetramitiformis]|uniref:Uncharacterized protein n=1 Tax=Cymbomonas tetramitiformis TaxID=36881 RepID=A0AAE0KPB3_9CHLO|nr:hypothetical protein CYMTET_35290 [Cymbomonas tetramitiformis]